MGCAFGANMPNQRKIFDFFVKRPSHSDDSLSPKKVPVGSANIDGDENHTGLAVVGGSSPRTGVDKENDMPVLVSPPKRSLNYSLDIPVLEFFGIQGMSFTD